ncbi:MAG: holo-ACP synthase [Bacteroidia bacterium]|nr:MAG: holo-ACP synthase [Bacteroidia bacterium]
MIIGIGTDIINVDRVEQKISKNQGFLEWVFATNEIEYCKTKTYPFQHFAARFAAKEAFFKALGTGWTQQTFFNEVSIVNDEKGKPSIELLGTTAETLSWLKHKKIHLSISHEKDYAQAFVVIEE